MAEAQPKTKMSPWQIASIVLACALLAALAWNITSDRRDEAGSQSSADAVSQEEQDDETTDTRPSDQEGTAEATPAEATETESETARNDVTAAKPAPEPRKETTPPESARDQDDGVYPDELTAEEVELNRITRILLAAARWTDASGEDVPHRGRNLDIEKPHHWPEEKNAHDEMVYYILQQLQDHYSQLEDESAREIAYHLVREGMADVDLERKPNYPGDPRPQWAYYQPKRNPDNGEWTVTAVAVSRIGMGDNPNITGWARACLPYIIKVTDYQRQTEVRAAYSDIHHPKTCFESELEFHNLLAEEPTE